VRHRPPGPFATLFALMSLAVSIPPAIAVPLPAARPQAARTEKAEEPAKAEKLEPSATEAAEPGAATVPLPAPRPGKPVASKPEQPSKTEPAPAAEKPAEPAQPFSERPPDSPQSPPLSPPPDVDCSVLATGGEAEFEHLPPIREGQCGAENPIRLKAVKLKTGERLELTPGMTLRCGAAVAFVTWIREDVQPRAKADLGGPITATRNTGDLECRGRNRRTGGKISEHGRANAIDILAFRKTSGEWMEVEKPGAGQAFLDHVRKQACVRFHTVLGPGSDVYHYNHLHLDMARRGRRGDTRYCR
jgi:hypothetical protein